MQKLKIIASERVKDNAAFREFLEAMPYTFDHEGTMIHSGRNVLKVIETKGFGLDGIHHVVVKRYHKLLWFQQLIYSLLCKSKGRKAFDNTEALRKRGFEPAAALSLVEVWNRGLYLYSFFVAEMVQGEQMTKLIRRLKEEHQQETIEKLICEYATLVKNMHERGVLYRDLNGGNVICKQDEQCGQWHFYLVDTDRVRLYEENRHLDLKTATKDLILMKPELGTNEMFQEEYLRQRNLYTPEAANYLRRAQYDRYDRK